MSIGLIAGVCALIFLFGGLSGSRLRRAPSAAVEMVNAGSGEPLKSLFEGLQPIAYFNERNWRGPQAPTGGHSNDGFLWRVGAFLGLVDTVYAQENNCNDLGCYGMWLTMQTWPCICGQPTDIENIMTSGGDMICVAEMNDGEIDCNSCTDCANCCPVCDQTWCVASICQ